MDGVVHALSEENTRFSEGKCFLCASLWKTLPKNSKMTFVWWVLLPHFSPVRNIPVSEIKFVVQSCGKQCYHWLFYLLSKSSLHLFTTYIHSFTHSLTHLLIFLINSLIYSVTFNQSLTNFIPIASYSLTHSLTHLPTYLFSHLVIEWLT